MKTTFKLLLLLIISVSTVAAGQIYGTLRVDGRGAQGATVKITCQSKTSGPVTSESDGSYRIYAAGSGRCTFHVSYAKRSGEVTIFSSNNAIKYDFDLLPGEPGKYTLNRR